LLGRRFWAQLESKTIEREVAYPIESTDTILPLGAEAGSEAIKHFA